MEVLVLWRHDGEIELDRVGLCRCTATGGRRKRVRGRVSPSQSPQTACEGDGGDGECRRGEVGVGCRVSLSRVLTVTAVQNSGAKAPLVSYRLGL